MRFKFALFLFSLLVISSNNQASELKESNRYFYEVIQNIHQNKVRNVDRKWIDYIRYYRQFFIEGEGLDYFCKEKPKVFYKDSRVRDIVKNSIVATLQYTILEHSIAAIAMYAKELEFTEDEYINMYESLLINSCSINTSVMSHRKIKNLFSTLFFKNEYKLPSVKGNPFFPSRLYSLQSNTQRLTRELYYTTELFKASCGWGQRFESLRGLESLVKNPVVASFVIRQLAGRKLRRKVLLGESLMEESEDTNRIFCDGVICRKREYNQFNKIFPRAIGSASLYDDLRSLYCQDLFESKSENEPDIDQRLKDITKRLNGEDKYRNIEQFISLITKAPSLNVWTKNKDVIEDYLKMSLELFWDDWSKNVINKLSEELFFEEPIYVEIVDKSKFLNPLFFRPQVMIDINSGEFDKAYDISGKTRFKFYIDIPKKDLLWFYNEFRTYDPTRKEYNEEFEKRFMAYILQSYDKFKDKLKYVSIYNDISKLLFNSLKDQLFYFELIEMDHQPGHLYRIPININVSPFALLVLKNKKIMQNKLDEEKSVEKGIKLESKIDNMADK